MSWNISWIEKNYRSLVKILNKLAIISPIVLLGGALFWIVPGLTAVTPFTDYLAYIFGTLSGLILVTSLFAIPASYLQTKYQPKKGVLTAVAVRKLSDHPAKQEDRISDWLQNVAIAKDSLSAPSFFSIRLPKYLQKASVYVLADQKEMDEKAMQESAASTSPRQTTVLNIDF